MYHLGRRVREKLAGSDDPRDRAVLDLNWNYTTEVENGVEEPSAESVLCEINGYDSEGNPLDDYLGLKDDGSTACGCWIYSGVYKDGVNQAARRKPWKEQTWVAPEWGWAWPMNRRILYNRASADPEGKPWSERKKYVWWDEEETKWVGQDVPDFLLTKPPDYVPEEGAFAEAAHRGDKPFVMQPDGTGWLYVPVGVDDGPLPTHYEPE
jgi:formate dehydrogenase major subunit